MIRLIKWGLPLCLVAVAASASGQDPQAALRRDVDAMTANLGSRMTPQQVAADAQRIAAGYRSLGPYARGFSASQLAANRDVARRSLAWLSRASMMYGRDPIVAQAFFAGYDSIGNFYQDFGPLYQPGAFVAWSGASRLARRMAYWQAGDASRYERDMERYALAYGTIAAAQGALLVPWSMPGDLPIGEPPPTRPTVVVKPVELPMVDPANLTADEKASWIDARDRFRSVAPRVHQARQLLAELSGRLDGRRMVLNPADAATAMKMQGYLEDAADLIGEKEFALAVQALIRADYLRGKLKGVTGQ
jgi:hypothetical protein